jgi:hypothetical protein
MSALQGLKDLAIWAGGAATAVACTYAASIQSILGKRPRVDGPAQPQQQQHGGRGPRAFRVGEEVEIHSESGGGWVAGAVVSLAGDEPTVRYRVGGCPREKVVYAAGLASQLRRRAGRAGRAEQGATDRGFRGLT